MTFKAFMLSLTYNNEMDTVTDDICGNNHREAVFYIVSGRLGRDKDTILISFLLHFFRRACYGKNHFGWKCRRDRN